MSRRMTTLTPPSHRRAEWLAVPTAAALQAQMAAALARARAGHECFIIETALPGAPSRRHFDAVDSSDTLSAVDLRAGAKIVVKVAGSAAAAGTAPGKSSASLRQAPVHLHTALRSSRWTLWVPCCNGAVPSVSFSPPIRSMQRLCWWSTPLTL